MNNLNLSDFRLNPPSNLNPTSIIRRTIYPTQNLNAFHNLQYAFQQQQLHHQFHQPNLIRLQRQKPPQVQLQPIPNFHNFVTVQPPSNNCQRPDLYNSFSQQKNRDISLLENFICSLPDSANFYCNACCLELLPKFIDDHLRKRIHLNSKKKLNNQLLAVNLFQISKHYDQQLTNSLERNFLNFESDKQSKISGIYL